MKTFKARRGPFRERLYSAQEAEPLSEGPSPDRPEDIRIEGFIGMRLGLTPVYNHLSSGIRGFTEFGLKAMAIARERYRRRQQVNRAATQHPLAHGAGRSLAHAHLFALEKELMHV
jgi:hypothetical protein